MFNGAQQTSRQTPKENGDQLIKQTVKLTNKLVRK